MEFKGNCYVVVNFNDSGIGDKELLDRVFGVKYI